jgi:hypothetical protein
MLGRIAAVLLACCGLMTTACAQAHPKPIAVCASACDRRLPTIDARFERRHGIPGAMNG